MKVCSFVLTISFIYWGNVSAQINASVQDKVSKLPLAYVSAGIIGKNIATITDEKGNMSFGKDIIDEYIGDTIKISLIGYKPQYFIIGKNHNQLSGITYLEPDTLQLNSVTIYPNKFDKRKKLGTSSESVRMVSGWGRAGTGGERGIKISLENLSLIETISFHIAQNNYKKVLFRLHVRQLQNGYPAEELLNEEIFITTNISKGWVKENLSDKNIIIKGDVMVSIELVKAWGTCKSNCMLFSLGYLKGTLYAKEASEGIWTIKNRMSPSINLELFYGK
jgi:hypothetical protein